MAARPEILLIDDSDENLVALEALLGHHEAELLEARSGDEALELLLVNDVALALVDVQMPDMDGIELARTMRASERARDVPVIFVTAGGHERARVLEGYELGAVDFLVKPIEPHVLDAKVAVFLQLWRQRQQLAESEIRARLLARTAGRLLASDEPQRIVEDLCREVMATLDCQVFFNFLLDPGSSVLRLNACAGIPDEEAAKIATLGLGVGICGRAARAGRPLVAEDILVSSDPRADLVRSYGVQAYCCHPLQAEGRVLGTLSFGTRKRRSFTAGEVEFMRMIADQVSTAMQRMRERRVLALANERLEEADRHRNDFLAVLSHELRNPLAPIKNSLYVLDHAAPGGDRARRAKEILHRQVNQLSRLVDDLLDVTRITRNKIVLQRSTLELNDLVRRAVEDQRSMFERGEVAVELQPAPGAVHVHGDDARLVQVVSNLLQNAAKFTPAGGTVRVLVECDEPSGRASIRVSDDGVGMEPDTVSRLFEPFMQADASLDRSKGGLGLGLALVKGLVELHGGEVIASSEGLGKGSELVVHLPLVAGKPDAREVATPAPSCTGLRVLVCEDNVDAAESLRVALEIDEHRVEVAHDGPEGLAKARVFRPEVVFCDIGLPGMDGYEVARAFRADQALRDTFLVALTGYALPDDLERAKAAGFDRHLAKPPSLRNIEALLWTVRKGPAAAGPGLAPVDERG